MEPAGLISDSNWSSFAFEESEFMSQLFCNYPCSNLQEFDSNSDVPASLSWYTSTSHEDSTVNNIMQETGKGGETKFNANSSLYSNSTTWPHDVSNTSLGDSDYVNGDSSGCSFINVFPGEEPNACSVDLFIMLNEEDHKKDGANDNYFGESNLNASELQVVPTTDRTSPKRKLLTSEADQPKVDDHSANNQTEYPKKKTRVSRHAQRNPRIGQARKNLKVPATAISAEQEDNIVTSPNGQSSSSYSEDDSNASEETHGVASSSSKGCKALNVNGKTRASRGSATDPQSLYARKRRERINERLRILQNLVPNGTKVDISTMLEEAVQYVKFLQLQIKLLSSDDLWMYAPIAYNGMDIGLDLKISPPQ